MRALPWFLALFIVSLPACKGQSPTTPGPTPPAAEDRPAGTQDDAPAPTSSGPDHDSSQPAPPRHDLPRHDLPQQGDPCPEGKCRDGMTCLSYYGIAGASGPKLTSCEIPCADDRGACPEGQQCVTIADGPGSVCRAL